MMLDGVWFGDDGEGTGVYSQFSQVGYEEGWGQVGLLLREGKRRDEMVELYEGTLEGWRGGLRFKEKELLVSNIRDRLVDVV